MAENIGQTPTWLDLYDWRRQVASIYRDRETALRGGEDELAVWQRFRAQKDTLFARHSQSPLGAESKSSFSGLDYFPYDPSLRIEAEMEALMSDEVGALDASGPHNMTFKSAARLHFTIEGIPAQLTVYWIDVYGGGLFLPFRDLTCPEESYGGGRYLFDTVKGSDFMRVDATEAPQPEERQFGYTGGRIILDFNYAYNPSCAYDPQWVCPLAPKENRLTMPIRAGERLFTLVPLGLSLVSVAP